MAAIVSPTCESRRTEILVVKICCSIRIARGVTLIMIAYANGIWNTVWKRYTRIFNKLNGRIGSLPFYFVTFSVFCAISKLNNEDDIAIHPMISYPLCLCFENSIMTTACSAQSLRFLCVVLRIR